MKSQIHITKQLIDKYLQDATVPWGLKDRWRLEPYGVAMKTDNGGRGCDIVRILEEMELLLEMPPEAESKEEEHEEEEGEEGDGE